MKGAMLNDEAKHPPAMPEDRARGQVKEEGRTAGEGDVYKRQSQGTHFPKGPW